ncbi:MAG: gfo/Idh/MocA family oxidoreductase [Sulfobacillus thermosulfidooxidans]|uniref:Oxidoreductase n=1 Tax=Sulfobacillus thermotolerans TaxID=338644 RepID=A0ABN5H2X4_9FIRM|nr:Gfo/Idh/MocA family oxidoreductase [Sulfobacillus sp. hq2]AUW95095.1 oxidoreductase [Sulfobacillus thermotolerans]MCY0908616.1 Gfo/Idh/MocA family oxidoreductase [Sulfobacillus thermotolerans]POB10299.1 oxidoreductase [Sulfobacillus sp. hq2]PSR36176.1 MAG: gfo/Idh/MocA family oxidoreductase [Sulfobacillus thermosulfidooxidans]
MTIRTALIGCGKIGQKHLQALVHQQALELVATVDPDRAKADAAAVAFDAEAFDDALAAFDAMDLDAAIIAAPSGLHRALAFQALDRGLHVMIEKPLALSYHDAQAIVDYGRQRGVVVVVTQFNRMLPTVSKLLAAHQEGRLGRVVNGGVAVRWARPQSYYDEAPWRGTFAMDGGVLFNQAIHALDVLLQVMGPVDEVFAHTATLTHAIEAEDTVAGSLRFVSGALASVVATTCVPQTNLEERITVVGDQGVVMIGPTVQQIATWRVGTDDEAAVRQAILDLPSRPSWQSHHDALQDFAEAIVRQTPARLDAATALPSIQVIEGLMRSGREGRVVKMDEIARS